MSELLSSSDVVVVGAGLAGLTAAAVAARAGVAVTLLDAQPPGGRARSVTKHGYVLNEGGHALYRNAGGRAVLDGLGVRLSGGPPRLAAYRIVWDGEVHKLPVSAPAILASRLLGMRSKRLLGGWFGDIVRTAERAGERSLADWLDGERARPDVRKWLLALGRLTTYSATPERMPARSVLGQLAPGGVWYLDGGWQTIVDELLRVGGQAGVRTVPTAATAVTAERGRWSVATPDGGAVAAAAVVLAVAPRVAARLLGDDPAGWVERAGPVARAACLDVGGAPGEIEFLLSADEPLYLSLHSGVARLAPAGRALYSVMRYLEPDDATPALVHRSALDAHADRAGLPAGDDREIDRFLAAPVVAHGTPRPGTPRPSGDELAARGVLAAGDWIGPRLLADAALTSGAAAGAAAARHATTAGAGRRG